MPNPRRMSARSDLNARRSKKAPLFDHFVGASEQGTRTPTYDVCDADGSSSSRAFASAKSAVPHPASKNR